MAKASSVFGFVSKKRIGDLDQTFWQKDCFVVGVDEVGRGSLAGPVTAGAVVLNPMKVPVGINDSKRLTPNKRQDLFPKITEQCLGYNVAHVYPGRIAEIGIRRATLEAMKLAVMGLFNELRSLIGDGVTTIVLVDGVDMVPLGPGFTQRAVIRGDSKSLSIAAASILAKVVRDWYMNRAAKEFPNYGWRDNSGYGTPKHIRAIRRLGLSPLHRRGFCDKWVPEESV
jgi:ribonuclease HII